jgi:hypothetical protein
LLHPLTATILGGLASLLLVQGLLLPALLLATDRSMARKNRTPPDAPARPESRLADSPSERS